MLQLLMLFFFFLDSSDAGTYFGYQLLVLGEHTVQALISEVAATYFLQPVTGVQEGLPLLIMAVMLVLVGESPL